MFNIFKRNTEDTEAIERLKAEDIRRRKVEALELNRELRTQSIKNVSYLDSALKTMLSQISYIKTRGSEKNKIRKEFLKTQVEWYKIKLIEENNMLNYYNLLKS